MAELELPQLAAQLDASCQQRPAAHQGAARAAPRPRKPKEPAPALPMRQSARQRGAAPADVTNTVHEEGHTRLEECKAGTPAPAAWHPDLRPGQKHVSLNACAEYLTQEEYLAREGISVESITSDGCFRGYDPCSELKQCRATQSRQPPLTSIIVQVGQP